MIMISRAIQTEDGQFYQLNAVRRQFTGCSNAGLMLEASSPSQSLDQLPMYRWNSSKAKAMTYQQGLGEILHEGCLPAVKGSTARLHYLVGRLAREFIDCFPSEIPRNAVGMFVGDSLELLCWSKSDLILGSDDYDPPTYMLDPQKSIPLSAYLKSGAIITSFAKRPRTLGRLADLQLPELFFDRESPHYEPAFLPDRLLMEHVRPSMVHAKLRGLRHEVWNPEYTHITDTLPWWLRLALEGRRVPSAKVMHTKLLNYITRFPRMTAFHVGGNYGVEHGGESCRIVVHIQSESLKQGKVMDSIYDTRTQLYSSACPIIYRSPDHSDSVVGSAFISTKPITWKFL